MKTNSQPALKAVHKNTSDTLKIFKIFPTIQGEGPFAGRPAVFIRLYGCNLQCPMCDTDYTSTYVDMTPVKISQEASWFVNSHDDKPLVVITGGEPFRQNITPMVEELLGFGFTVQIETNGSLYLEDFPYDKVTIVCSPKTGSIHKKLEPHIDAMKYVLHADEVDVEDGLPLRALAHPAKPKLAKPPKHLTINQIYVQPVDEDDEFQNSRHLQAAVNSSRYFGYTFCLQVHKVIEVE